MNKLTGFAIRNSKLLSVIATLIWFTLLMAVAVFFEFSYIICGIIACILSLLSKRYIDRIGWYAVKSAYKKLNDKCDPYPMYEVCESLIENSTSAVNECSAKMNKMCAFYYLGKTTEAYSILAGINVEEIPDLPISTKALYYYDLMLISTVLGLFEEAELYFEKGLQICNEIEDSKEKDLVSKTFNDGEFWATYRGTNYEKAIELLNKVECSCLLHKVHTQFNLGKCYIALGETEKAREALDFVIKNANKTCFGKEAEELLKTL